MRIKKDDWVVKYNNFTTNYRANDRKSYIVALDVKAVLEDAGFDFLG